MKTMAICSVAAAVLAVSMAAAPRGPMAGWGQGQFAQTPLGRLVTGNVGRMMVLRSELNLSGEQRAEIREILVAHRTEIATAAEAVWEDRIALRKTVMTDGADETAIRAAADELATSIGDAAVLAGKLREQVAPVLTDAQRDTVGKHLGDMENATADFFEKLAAR